MLDGWAGDAAISLAIGRPRPADMRLIEAAQAALRAGIAAAVAGAKIGDISAAIAAVGRAESRDEPVPATGWATAGRGRR